MQNQAQQHVTSTSQISNKFIKVPQNNKPNDRYKSVSQRRLKLNLECKVISNGLQHSKGVSLAYFSPPFKQMIELRISYISNHASRRAYKLITVNGDPVIQNSTDIRIEKSCHVIPRPGSYVANDHVESYKLEKLKHDF